MLIVDKKILNLFIIIIDYKLMDNIDESFLFENELSSNQT